MVDYNPSSPIILGQEWVPIKNQYITFGENQAAGSEIGTSFRLTSDTQVNNARFYMDDWVYGRFVNEGVTFAIYPRGQEDQSGPIQKVVIPCTSGSTTGGITFSSPATDVPTALANPGTIRQSGLIFNGVAGFTAFRAQFGVMQNTYAQALAGKRIVGVTLATQVIIDNSMTVDSDEPIESTIDIELEFGLRRISSNASFVDWQFQHILQMESGDNQTVPPRNSDDSRRDRLGNFSMFGGTMITTADTYPWTYEELTKFDSAFGANSVAVQAMGNFLGANIPLVRFTYMALEVYFCEEKRVAFGTQVFDAGPVPLGTEVRYTRGANQVQLYDLTGATDPTLPAGEYTLTVSQTDFGDNFDVTDKTNTSVKLNAIRELYTLPSFDTVEVLLPGVIDDTALGQAFIENEVVVVPQLSLHTSTNASLTEVHPYGRQAVAQVWGNVYAQQDLFISNVGVTITYPYVRFYARRWGDTTIPLTIAGQGGLAASTASITPDEFDALPETLDGWKEVTLQFDTPPSMGTVGTPSWRWTATGETSGNRWEVLAAAAPALSGVPGNLFNMVPTAQQLYDATYYAPNGSVVELEWMPQGVASQWVSGAGIADDATDAFLIFAQQPPAVSGLGVSVMCQPLSGVGQECDIDPCCVPTSLMFNQVSWDPALLVSALFVPGTNGDNASTPDAAALDITGDIDLRVDATLDAWVSGTPSGANDYLIGKYDSSTNRRSYVLRLSSTGTLQLLWSTDGTAVNTRSATVAPAPIDGRLAVRATLDVNNGSGGHTVTFYSAPTIEGPWSQLGTAVTTAGTTSIFSGGASLLISGIDEGGAGLAPGLFHAGQVRDGIDGTIVANPDFRLEAPGTTSFVDSAGRTWTVNGNAEIVGDPDNSTGTYELQRMDILTDWQTIMLGAPTTSGFSDFEARVGIQSSYRIRSLDLYEFEGDWSSIVTATIPEPGVEIGCEGGHVLIFTSNERQGGDINLAYSSVWFEQQVEEGFVFPEAGFTTLQPMYNRDYFTAFHPTERGGESFTRTVLVQAAAIDPATLADFRSLRDMAWADVSYICVRDEEGNRWFASVNVPSGRVLNNRRLYMAPVAVVEVTDTASPVDPSSVTVAGTVTSVVCE